MLANAVAPGVDRIARAGFGRAGSGRAGSGRAGRGRAGLRGPGWWGEPAGSIGGRRKSFVPGPGDALTSGG
ncbi:hypothetical protein ACFYOT_21020 [Saccharothrix saharensis]|uniref:hypothetical protein n=1 Tax=Saccharothrix saharensis TaxID=571190 RepID=UPI0036C13425